MYIATFMQERIKIDDSSATCETGGSFTGKSRLYAISLENGGVVPGNDGKYTEYDGVKIVNVTDMGDSIAFGLAVLDPSIETDTYSAVINDDENLYLKVLEKEANGGGPSDEDEEPSNANGLPSGNESIINYWLYK
jgi:hypothetical protein